MKILVADDHSVVRKGLIQIMNEMDDISSIDEAVNGFEVLEKTRLTDYDLLVLDLSMPDKNGLDVLKDLKIQKPYLRTLVLSTYPEELFAIRSFRAGASGYLNKNSAPDELEKAIRKVIGGGRYVSESLADSMVEHFGREFNQLPHQKLSDRELQVFQMIAEGKQTSQISKDLSLSRKTISSHKTNILEKMNLKSSADIVQYAIRNKLVY
jgi:DNA-binding NarL/FixJ family response regulator